MIPTNFKPADPHFTALVLPVLMQIGELRARGWPIDYSDPPFLPPNWRPCSECEAFRWAGCNKVSAGVRTGWCQQRIGVDARNRAAIMLYTTSCINHTDSVPSRNSDGEHHHGKCTAR
jgi:hypothetical protein